MLDPLPVAAKAVPPTNHRGLRSLMIVKSANFSQVLNVSSSPHTQWAIAGVPLRPGAIRVTTPYMFAVANGSAGVPL
jgi:hypothetical protein